MGLTRLQKTAAVPCPHCGYAYTTPVHARQQPWGYRRRRKCERDECGKGFITYEVTATELNRWAVEGSSPFGGKKGKSYGPTPSKPV